MKKIKRIILFRFHKDFDICKNHLEIIRKFNPQTQIFGLYGGSEKNFNKAKRIGIKNIFMIPMDDWVWKWKNGDFCVRWWYKKIGYKIKFDMLHLIEWDLILLDSVDSYFKHIKNGVAITDLQPLSRIYNTWWWVSGKQGRYEWLRLKKYVKEKFNYNQKPLAGVFPGACLSKKFLEKYSKLEIGGVCNDEVRVPLFAQIFRMKVRNTKLKNNLFNADGKEITPAMVYNGYKQGIKAFHPVRQKLNLQEFSKINK